jgi:tight adherence protein B
MVPILIVTILLLIALIIGGYFFLGGASGKQGEGSKHSAMVSNNLRSLVAAQRNVRDPLKGGDQGKKMSTKDNLALAAAAESSVMKRKLATGSRLTLEKRLTYAQWSITPLQFRIAQLFFTILVFLVVRMYFNILLQLICSALTPLFVDGILQRAIDKRFQIFDRDYPTLLLSYVSLLKTGMTVIGGLDAAAKGLPADSLVKTEVELLIERLKLGLTEDQAINAFGEDIAHPELELFVQSLLLSKRVGGNLSGTLERLSKQVRKRQQFRQQAVSVVGLERSSIKAIAFIMTTLQLYILYSSPELILPAFSHQQGSQIFQGGLGLIILGFYWSKIVTNIKV